MALSFTQEPVGDSDKLPVITNWNPIVPYTLYQGTSIAAFFYYKLILEVKLNDDSGTQIAKIKQRRNGYQTDIDDNKARAVFDLRDIANSQLEDTIADSNLTSTTIHKLGANVATKIYSHNNNQVVKLYVKGYQNYSSAANISPADVTSGSINDTKYYIAASLPLETARGTADFQGTAFRDYQLTDENSLLLSDVQKSYFAFADIVTVQIRVNYVQEDDYHTIGFLNDKTAFDTELDKIAIKYYDIDGDELSDTKLNNSSANGGLEPDDGSLTNATRLLYFGCGPANLEAQSIDIAARPSNNAGWVAYEIRALDGSNAAHSDKYYFVKQEGSCRDYKIRRLGWINSLGCYDYYNFKMKSTQTVEVNRNNYETLVGNFSSDMYSYDNFGRGKNTRKVTAIVKETINTDYITEEDGQLLEKLLFSKNVMIIENADTTYTVPVMITDNSMIRKTRSNDTLIKYTINIEYANPINTNS
jgi:hypothetical protein